MFASTENVYVESLKSYIGRFAFFGDPLDVALRRLLMDVGLPKETQQIDRVIEAFANRSQCFYDNIVFAPFIFIEDPLDNNATVNANHEAVLPRPSTPAPLPSPLATTANVLLNRPKIDPYYLITNNLLEQLRVKVDTYIPTENPFRWDGTGVAWDYDEILLAFIKGLDISISSADSSRMSTAFFGLSVGGFPNSQVGEIADMPDVYPAPTEIWNLKLIKVAILNRKDDVLERGKKTNSRKWRPYCVALTRSQLLLFRDLTWTASLHSWSDTPKPTPLQSTQFRPDEVIPMKDALAVFDTSYTKHMNTFRLIVSDGRHVLFQASNEREMNEWISRINYGSAFKSHGIRMRPLGISREDVELTGIAAAASHLQKLRSMHPVQTRVLTWGHDDSVAESRGNMDNNTSAGITPPNFLDSQLDSPVAPEVEGASQLKETFDAVKAGLAAAHFSTSQLTSKLAVSRSSVENFGAPAEKVDPSYSSTRAQMVRAQVQDLEALICTINSEIDSNLHFARNVAVLAPFQKSTRDRLLEAVQGVSKRVQALRLDVTRLICHRSILLNDLEAERKGFKRATSLALQAATEVLHNVAIESSSSRALSQDNRADNSTSEEAYRFISHSFDSSSGVSFRTALDFGPDWPSSGEALTTSTFRETSRITESPFTDAHENQTGYPFPDEHSHMSESVLNDSVQDPFMFEKPGVVSDTPEEQAEEWDKTRAAKRVSLVRLPSDLRLSTMLAKSPRHPHFAILSEDVPIGMSLLP
ncbi:hypothetical protein ID866_624 [Astraeus odoratus]|nr:hypothetical protein ID866_624 [Astraeus odoratus]